MRIFALATLLVIASISGANAWWSYAQWGLSESALLSASSGRAMPCRPDVPVCAIGLGSNLIVRDGGVPGVVVRLGRGFAGVAIEGDRVRTGAAVPDLKVAQAAQGAGQEPPGPPDEDERQRRGDQHGQ